MTYGTRRARPTRKRVVRPAKRWLDPDLLSYFKGFDGFGDLRRAGLRRRAADQTIFRCLGQYELPGTVGSQHHIPERMGLGSPAMKRHPRVSASLSSLRGDDVSAYRFR
jgi:hypothetical protein